MSNTYFWIVYFQDNSVSVALADQSLDSRKILAIGPETNWQDPESLISAVDASLSQALVESRLDPSVEPDTAAFVVPPFWINSDGRICDEHLSKIEPLCRRLQLKPLGFIAVDDAIVESLNTGDFPTSMVMVGITHHDYWLSLCYLGKIKERLRRHPETGFTPKDLELALIELKTSTALPPQVIIYGQHRPETVENCRSYPWVGRTDVETFLQLPDISSLNLYEVYNHLFDTIIRQLNPKDNHFSASPQDTEPQDDTDEEITAVTTPDITIDYPPQTLPSAPLQIVEPEDLGFTLALEADNPSVSYTSPILDTSIADTPVPKQSPTSPSRFKLPKITLPKFPAFPHLGASPILIGLAFMLLIFLPYFVFPLTVSIYVSPNFIEKELTLKIDPAALALDLTNGILPVDELIEEVSANESIKTTGTKLIGEKAKGEVVIFNNQDKAQSLAKGTILTDPKGQKFEIPTTSQIPSASYDLDKGVINMGQTRVLVSAVDIGTQGNIANGTKLTFADYSTSVLVAKSNQDFTGGTSQNVSAVAQDDRDRIQKLLDEKIKQQTEDKYSQQISSTANILKGTVKTSQSRVEISREVGEVTDELTGSVTSKVTAYLLKSSTKDDAVRQIVTSLPQSENLDFNLADFELTVEEANLEKAKVIIKGKSYFKFDTTSLSKQLPARSKTNSLALFKKNVPNYYDSKFKSFSPYYKLLKLNPPLSGLIHLEVIK